ncbi:hypothetical protein [Kribbella qitaiheensis]|uniref:hypothetical protein n=1 Tax=Kribbella qitaiheensis TaxID=1544730 RepID=UPI003D18EF01
MPKVWPARVHGEAADRDVFADDLAGRPGELGPAQVVRCRAESRHYRLPGVECVHAGTLAQYVLQVFQPLRGLVGRGQHQPAGGVVVDADRGAVGTQDQPARLGQPFGQMPVPVAGRSEPGQPRQNRHSLGHADLHLRQAIPVVAIHSHIPLSRQRYSFLRSRSVRADWVPMAPEPSGAASGVAAVQRLQSELHDRIHGLLDAAGVTQLDRQTSELGSRLPTARRQAGLHGRLNLSTTPCGVIHTAIMRPGRTGPALSGERRPG